MLLKYKYFTCVVGVTKGSEVSVVTTHVVATHVTPTGSAAK